MAVTWKKLAYVDDVVTKATFTTKGDILSASAASTPLILGVGANGLVLKALSTEASGLVWGTSGTPDAHATSHKNSGSDEILLHEFGEPTSAVPVNGQQVTDMVLHTVADATARNALTAVVGKIVWQTDELAPYVCTVAV